jgi:hypothetical protein
MKQLLKATVMVGITAGLTYAAKKYFESDFDKAVGGAKGTLRDIGSDITKKDKAVTRGVSGAI